MIPSLGSPALRNSPSAESAPVSTPAPVTKGVPAENSFESESPAQEGVSRCSPEELKQLKKAAKKAGGRLLRRSADMPRLRAMLQSPVSERLGLADVCELALDFRDAKMQAVAVDRLLQRAGLAEEPVPPADFERMGASLGRLKAPKALEMLANLECHVSFSREQYLALDLIPLSMLKDKLVAASEGQARAAYNSNELEAIRRRWASILAETVKGPRSLTPAEQFIKMLAKNGSMDVAQLTYYLLHPIPTVMQGFYQGEESTDVVVKQGMALLPSGEGRPDLTVEEEKAVLLQVETFHNRWQDQMVPRFVEALAEVRRVSPEVLESCDQIVKAAAQRQRTRGNGFDRDRANQYVQRFEETVQTLTAREAP